MPYVVKLYHAGSTESQTAQTVMVLHIGQRRTFLSRFRRFFIYFCMFFLHFKASFFKCSPTFVYMFTFRFLRLRAVVGALKPHCPAQCELLLLHVIAGCWSKIE